MDIVTSAPPVYAVCFATETSWKKNGLDESCNDNNSIFINNLLFIDLEKTGIIM